MSGKQYQRKYQSKKGPSNADIQKTMQMMQSQMQQMMTSQQGNPQGAPSHGAPIQDAQQSAPSQYQGPRKIHTETSIKRDLHGYMEVTSIDDIPIGTHVRYFTSNKKYSPDGNPVYRSGGKLVEKQGEYIKLQGAGAFSWSVQRVDLHKIFRKLTDEEYETLEYEKNHQKYKRLVHSMAQEVVRLTRNDTLKDMYDISESQRLSYLLTMILQQGPSDEIKDIIEDLFNMKTQKRTSETKKSKKTTAQSSIIVVDE